MKHVEIYGIGRQAMIYLDYSANTPEDPVVLETFLRTEQTYIGNPNSIHPAGQAARAEMARVTDSIAALLGVSPAELIYTSGASESLKGIAKASCHVGKYIIYHAGARPLLEGRCRPANRRAGRLVWWISVRTASST